MKDSTFDFRGVFLGIVAFFCVAIFVGYQSGHFTLSARFPLIIGRCLEIQRRFFVGFGIKIKCSM